VRYIDKYFTEAVEICRSTYSGNEFQDWLKRAIFQMTRHLTSAEVGKIPTYSGN